METGAPTTIGHYRLGDKLGEGGMGEVWRATDTKLNRQVAIKVLPAAVANDALRLARFTREAQVLASLNHPGIAAIYGVEHHALVMELVDGPTLAERIGGRAMPLEEVLPLARQMAEALAYAHDKGVVHRDLKPANIKVTPDGTVKILDFGLAKAMSSDSSTSAPSTSTPSDAATISAATTLAGTVLGTAAYMAPEQARGQNVDRRADVWAYGVVLYEMLTGERPFGGPTISDTLAAVLTKDPDLENVPVRLRALVATCLQKNPRERWGCMADLRRALDNGLDAPPTAAPHTRWPLLAASAVAGLAIATAAALYWLNRPATLAPVETSIAAPAQEQFAFDPFHQTVAMSPDGSTIVFLATGADGTPYLWLRRLNALTPQRLAGTGNAVSPFFSPDGKAIGFGANGELMRMDLAGGLPVQLASAPDLHGASWNRQGVIVYAPNASAALLRVSAQGSTPAPALAASTLTGADPWFLPDGQHLLFLAGDGSVRVGTLGAANTRVLLTRGTSQAEYGAGYLLYGQGTTLIAQAFDPQRLTLTGGPVPTGAVLVSLSGEGLFSTSASGGLALIHSSAASSAGALGWYDLAGKPLSTVETAGASASGAELSPDGKRALVQMDGNLWILDTTSGTRTQFTLDAKSTTGIWSPDGREIIFGSTRNGQFALYRQPADNSSPAQLVTGSAGMEWPSSWSPDGRFLFATRNANDRGAAILPLMGNQPPRWLQPSMQSGNAQISPDGRWIAFESSAQSGEGPQIYVTPFPGPGGVYRVSHGYFNTEPRWSRDGKRIYYVAAARGSELMAVSFQGTAGSVAVGAPQPLFGPLALDPFDTYDVSADGTRVLANEAAEGVLDMELFQNWPQGLNRVGNTQ